MQPTERSVLHVLPHPGGGGQTYVGLLEEIPGYRFTRVFLASGTDAAPWRVVPGLVEVARRAHGYDLLHVHGEVAAGLCLPLLAVRPSIVTLHGLHLARRLSGYLRWAAALNLRVLLRATDRVICVSRAEHAVLADLVGRHAAARAVVLRNGVRIQPSSSEADRAAVRAKLGIPAGEVVGIWVGSLDERKDPLSAVSAAVQAGVRLIVVGDGPLRSRVEQAAPAEHVHVLGARGDVPRLLAAADLYVLTSHREGLSLSLLEAMAQGLPPIVTDLLENVEAVGDTGLAVSPGDEAELAAALGRLAGDDAERARLGDRARVRVARLFSAEETISRTSALYDEVLAGRAAPDR